MTVLCLGLALLMSGIAQARPQKSGKAGSSHRTTKGKTSKKSKAAKKPKGQQAMNPERVREIQAALIREHYMDGEPNGVWDARSKTAMQKFQAAQGWQSKVVPDSRALIKLGLGPDHAGLLNPETAAVQAVPGGGAAHNNTPAPEH